MPQIDDASLLRGAGEWRIGNGGTASAGDKLSRGNPVRRFGGSSSTCLGRGHYYDRSGVRMDQNDNSGR